MSITKTKNVSVKVNNSTETATELKVKQGIRTAVAKAEKHQNKLRIIEDIKRLSVEQQRLQYRSDVQKQRLKELDLQERRLQVSKRNRSEKEDELSKINEQRRTIHGQFHDSHRQRLHHLNEELEMKNKELNS